jgi:hypothetical protein
MKRRSVRIPVGPNGSQSHRTAYRVSGALAPIGGGSTIVPFALPACNGIAEHNCISASSYESRVKCWRQVVAVGTRSSAQRREGCHVCGSCGFALRFVSLKLFQALQHGKTGVRNRRRPPTQRKDWKWGWYSSESSSTFSNKQAAAFEMIHTDLVRAVHDAGRYPPRNQPPGSGINTRTSLQASAFVSYRSHKSRYHLCDF